MESEKRAWVRFGGCELGPEDFLLELKVDAEGGLLRRLGVRRVLAREAGKRGLKASKKELAGGLGALLAELDIADERQAAAWLKSRNLTEDGLAPLARERVLVEKLKEAVAPDAEVEERFSQNGPDYAGATVSVVECETEGEARELMLAVREGESQWPGGDIRELTRAQAPEEIAAALFSSKPGDLAGPLESDEGTYDVWRLLKHREPELDDELRERIREALFAEFTESLLLRQPPEFLA